MVPPSSARLRSLTLPLTAGTLALACAGGSDEPIYVTCGPGTKVVDSGCVLDDGAGGGDGDTGDGDTGDGDDNLGDGDASGGTPGDGDGDGAGGNDPGAGGSPGAGGNDSGAGGNPGAGGNNPGAGGSPGAGGASMDGDPKWLVYEAGNILYAVDTAPYPPGEPVQLSNSTSYAPRWSPDGQYLAYCATSRCGYRFMADSVPGPFVPVAAYGGCNDLEPIRWTGNSNVLATKCNSVELAAATPSGLVPVISVSNLGHLADFSADGTALAYSEDGILHLAPVGPDAAELAEEIEAVDLPQYGLAMWAPSGDRIAWRAADEAVRTTTLTEGAAGIQTVSETFASFFWSPDGTKLALDLGSTLAIATFSPTLTVTPVTGAEQSGNVVSWSPDSRYLLVNGYVIEKTSLVDTNDPTPSLIHLARYVEYGTWSADSTLLAGYDEVLYEVVAFDVGAPGTAHLVVNAVGVAKLEFSPIAPLLAVYGLGAQVHDLSSLPFVVPYWDLATFSTVTGGSWDLAGTRLAYTTSNTIWYSVTSANAVSAAVQADGVTAMDSLPRWQP